MKNKKILSVILLVVVITTLFVPLFSISAFATTSSFTVNYGNVTKVYQYDTGMTWGDWVASNYNVDGVSTRKIDSNNAYYYIVFPNEIFNNSTGDYLILVDRNILLENDTFIYSINYTLNPVYDYTVGSVYFSVHSFDSISLYSYDYLMDFSQWIASNYNVNGYSLVSFEYYLQDVVDCVCIENNSPQYYMLGQSKAGGFVTSSTLCSVGAFIVDTVYQTEGYQQAYQDGYDSGFTVGFKDGKQEGYDNGFTAGLNSAYGDNLIGSTLTAPIRALNNFVLYTSTNGFQVTLWHILGAVIGLSLFIAFLKVFVGG